MLQVRNFFFFFFFYLLSLYSPRHLTYRGSGRAIPLHALQITNMMVLMVGTLAHFFRSSIMHLKAIIKQLYTTMKVPFSLHFSFLMDFVLAGQKLDRFSDFYGQVL